MILLQLCCGFYAILLIFIAVDPFEFLISVEGYSQVIMYKQVEDNNEKPKIFKSLNMDLVYPRSFNSTKSAMTSTITYTHESSSPHIMMDTSFGHEEHANHNRTDFLNNEIFVTPRNIQTPEIEKQKIFDKQPELHNDKETYEPQIAKNQQNQVQNPHIQKQTSNLPFRQLISSGRAVDYRPSSYNLNNLIKPLYRQQTTSNVGNIIYPQLYQLSGRRNQTGLAQQRGQAAVISDRFTPGEAVASLTFNNNNKNHNHHIHDQSKDGKRPYSTNTVSSYVAPKDLYAFPPNLDAKYPAPTEDPKASLPSGKVTSYLPSPSGPLTNIAGYPVANRNPYNYPGPVNNEYLPPHSEMSDSSEVPLKNGTPAGVDEDGGSNDESIGVLPASAMGMADDIKSMENENINGDHHNHSEDEHVHHPNDDHTLTGYDDSKEYPTPPPGWIEDHPDTVQNHPNHGFSYQPDDHHPYIPSYPALSHEVSDIIYDNNQNYHDHHHHDLPPMTTTEAPLPEPPPEPRVKKYSYFYIGRKLWYIPLYFTVWFSFYVLWLIVKSIARHKVNLPNHYVSRRSFSDGRNEFSPTSKEYINQLTVKVLQIIDEFQEKRHVN